MKLREWVEKHLLSSFKIDYKNSLNLKSGDLVYVKSFDNDLKDVYQEYGYVVGDVNLDGLPWAKIHLQKTNKSVKIVLTDSLKKVNDDGSIND